ncbi:PTS system sucrose-specific IIC component [Paenibacillus sp. SORGH_AS306]|uniref:sucrose-specific PTS transporter subunit IIBC n=1 Tax=unclassified Paenibacillus TaxID=185978 RepID=UPI0027829347|nr:MULTISPECIES: sucrose-specific PTS transporter subunit IIBC [unclassified Paenibacillus]MDQ1234874.1 PTS system sucrose-specific IIC component [Paenibacillus sp. SORGH_AS_0306]MDR6111922.1 PTS system sucrose-specific IIC component [Paenibacillus sp. SORGH_AS_0338]
MSENQKIAQQVIEAVGGKDNIASFAHCATRLRIMVHNKELIDQERTENIDKVKGAFFNSGQYQIIFGTGTVNRIFEEVENLGVESTSKDDIKSQSKNAGNFFQRSIRTFGDVFVPIIPVLVATGLFMGLRGLLTQPQILALFGMTPDHISANFLLFTQVLTDTAFAFLPALVAWSAFRVFGGSPVLGIVLGLMLVNPALPNAYSVADGSAHPLTLFGFIPVVGYQGSVLPAFVIGLIGAKLEKALRKRIPEAIDLILTPFLTLLIMITLGLFAIGPIFHSLESVVLNATIYVLDMPYGIAGLLIGSLHQIIVVTGVHHIFNFLEIQLLERTGVNPFNAIITCAMAAQGGACLAVGLKTKDNKLKALALPSSLSAFLGITEPAIFGVNLRYMKPFIMGLIGGGIGGFMASLFHLAGSGMAITVIPGTLLYLNSQLPLYILCNVVAIAIAFTLTWLFGYKDKVVITATDSVVADSIDYTEPSTSSIESSSSAINNTISASASSNVISDVPTDTAVLNIIAPISGTLVPLEHVPDPAFAGKHMGEGIAIEPNEGKLYAPFDGTVAHVMDKSKHAIIVEHASGVQLLIHIGLDTVSLKGQAFTLHVKSGDSIQAGQLLIEFDIAMIQSSNLSVITPVIVPDGIEHIQLIQPAEPQQVQANEHSIMQVTYTISS